MSDNAKRLLLELEQKRREINRDTINPEIRELTLQELEPIVSVVARMRAAYVQSLFDLADKRDGLPTRDDVEQLRERRNAFDEIVAAVNALEAMIERGYVDVVPANQEGARPRAVG